MCNDSTVKAFLSCVRFWTSPIFPKKTAVDTLGGAESGALSAHSLQIDAELAEVVMAWDCLPTAVKVGILAMVCAASVTGQQEN